MKQNLSIRSADVFGAEIQYFRLEKRYWKPILQKFKDAGLKNVTTYVQWATHLVGMPGTEHPAGELDFDGRTNPNLNLHHFLIQTRNFMSAFHVRRARGIADFFYDK